MKSAVVIRHVHFEDLGSLAQPLREQGYSITMLDAGIDDLCNARLEQADLLIVLGAPIGAYDEVFYPFLLDELRLLRQRLAANRATLGICLGAQLMARALGARVSAMPRKEIGYAPLQLAAHPLLAPLDGVSVLHWHGDQCDLPSGAQCLASTALCAVQAFALGNDALGLQCHLEADARQIERWLIGHASELHSAKLDPREIRQQAQSFGQALESAAQQVFSAWLQKLA